MANVAERSQGLPTIVHITHWKAGSQWLHRILDQCCHERIVKPEIDGEHFLNQPVRPGGVYPTVYLNRDRVASVPVPRDTRFFAVLRDPRDTLVSLYYSAKCSHELSTPKYAELRRDLLSVPEEEGLLKLLASAKMAEVLRIHTSWTNTGIPILHYEALVDRDVELLLPLLTEACPLGVSREVIRAAIERNRFETLTGRARGVEDIESHFRRGQPGDWPRHFTPRVADAFEAQFGTELRALGYVGDANWTDEVEKRGDTLPQRVRSETAERRCFSIIMMLPQHRGHAVQAVRSWTEGQRYPSDRFELIVLSDGVDREVELTLSPYLRSTDRLLLVQNANRSVLLNHGINAATHSQIVFTEAHVEPEDSFLLELNHWLACHSTIDAVYCRVIPDSENHLAYWDARLYEAQVTKYADGNAWWNINIHAFSISKEKLSQAGAIDERYDLFSMLILAAKCRDFGMTIAYAPAPAVLHHYRTTLWEVESQTRSFVRDEFRYRQDHPGLDQLGTSVLTDRGIPHSDFPLRSHVWVAAMRHVATGNWRLIFHLARTQAVQLWNRITISSTLDSPARRLAFARIQCHLLRWSRRRLESPYRVFRQSIAAAEQDQLERVSASSSRTATIFRTGETPPFKWDSAVIGLHANEYYQGANFRWTQPVSFWRFGKVTKEIRIVFRLVPVRSDLRRSRIHAFWNGKRLGRDDIEYALNRLVVRIPSDARSSDLNDLVLIVSPLETAEGSTFDRRRLGLPIIQMSVEGATSACSVDTQCLHAA